MQAETPRFIDRALVEQTLSSLRCVSMICLVSGICQDSWVEHTCNSLERSLARAQTMWLLHRNLHPQGTHRPTLLGFKHHNWVSISASSGHLKAASVQTPCSQNSSCIQPSHKHKIMIRHEQSYMSDCSGMQADMLQEMHSLSDRMLASWQSSSSNGQMPDEHFQALLLRAVGILLLNPCVDDDQVGRRCACCFSPLAGVACNSLSARVHSHTESPLSTVAASAAASATCGDVRVI